MAEEEAQPGWAEQIVALIGVDVAVGLRALGLVLAVVFLGALAGRVPALMGEAPARRWEALGTGARRLMRLLFGVWGVLALVAAAAAIRGGPALIGDPSAGGIGLGALLVALLGAPFLIWGTAIRQNTLDIQREGHITDRISKAVEQLGAEKTIQRIGRPVTVWTGNCHEFVCFHAGADKPDLPPRSVIVSSKRSATFDGESGEAFEGNEYTVRQWEAEETRIQWSGQTPAMGSNEHVASEGDWKPFSETVPNIEVRLGAILALERIAQDSTRLDRGRDHVGVMEILCAYIRENAPAARAQFGEYPRGCERESLMEKLRIDPASWIDSLEAPRIDVQMALTVIGRRSAEQISIERKHPGPRGGHFKLDLSDSCLRRADMQNRNYANARFTRSLMDRAIAYGSCSR